MNNAYNWYSMLSKPTWAPPAWVFGPVWTILYALIIVSFGYVGYLLAKKRISFSVVVPFILNVAFNLAFTPIQFGLRSNLLAMADVILVLGTLIWALVAIRKHALWVVWINLPYLLWAAFATVLQITITVLNR